MTDEERLARIEEFVSRHEMISVTGDTTADIKWLVAQLLNEKMKCAGLVDVIERWAPSLIAEGRLSINDARSAMQGVPCPLRKDVVYEEMAEELRRMR